MRGNPNFAQKSYAVEQQKKGSKKSLETRREKALAFRSDLLKIISENKSSIIEITGRKDFNPRRRGVLSSSLRHRYKKGGKEELYSALAVFLNENGYKTLYSRKFSSDNLKKMIKFDS